MKKIILFIALTIFTYNFSIAQFNCLGLGVVDSSQLLYLEDAEQLYARLLQANSLKGTKQQLFSPDKLHEIGSALFTIVNDGDLPHWEEVIQQYAIHSRPTASTRNLVIQVDTAVLWNLSNYQSIQLKNSGNIQLDFLVEKFKFKLLEPVEFVQLENDPKTYLEIKLASSVSVDIYNLVSILKTLEGVRSAKPFLYPLSEDEIVKDIFMEHHGSYIDFTFSVSWDCDGGEACANFHNWVYRVNSDCSVSFLREEGDLLPLRDVNNFVSAGVFPNPTTDQVSVSLIAPSNTEIKMVLFSALGQIIHSEILETNTGILQFNLSLQNQPVGLYFIGFTSGEKVFTEKVLKR